MHFTTPGSDATFAICFNDGRKEEEEEEDIDANRSSSMSSFCNFSFTNTSACILIFGTRPMLTRILNGEIFSRYDDSSSNVLRGEEVIAVVVVVVVVGVVVVVVGYSTVFTFIPTLLSVSSYIDKTGRPSCC